MTAYEEPPAEALSISGWVVVALAAIAAWASVRAVEPRLESSGSVPAESFSAERALEEVEVLARAPRPVGSAAHRAARERLASRLGELGLEVEVREATVVRPLGRGAGLLAARVRNVVGRLAGRGGGRLTLAAHYDSQPQTPGAGDDASGAATILETLRALGPEWRPVPDVEVAITDGEELGLMGARALVETRREVEGPDLLLNFEARGQRGPVAMFETSEGNLGLLRVFADAVPRPFATSLAYEVYRRMPNDTDFTVFREAGVEGLNFGFIGGHPAYHSRLDTAGRLSLATLEQEGTGALGLVRTIGDGRTPTGAAGNAVYFNPWGTSFLVYPASWARPLSLAILVAVGALLAVLRLRPGMRWRGAFGALVLWVVGAAAASAVGWLFAGALAAAPSLLRSPYGEPYDFRGFTAVLAALVGAALLGIWALRGRGLAAAEVLGGTLLFWAALLVLLAWTLPGASYLAAWPLGFLGLGTVLASLRPLRGAPAVVVMGLAALPGLAVWAPTCDLVFQALGLDAAPLLAPTVALAWSLLALPLWAVAGGRRWRGALVLLAVGLAGAGALALRDERSADRPGVDTLSWLQDADGTARWFSLDAAADDWTGGFVDGRDELPSALAPDLEGLTGSAGGLDLPPPRVLVEQDEVRAGRRRLSLLLRSQRDATVLRALLRPGAPVAALRLGGRAVAPEEIPQGDLRLVLYGFGGSGARVELELEQAAAVDVELLDQSWGLPRELLTAPRPEDLIPAPGWLTDATFVAARRRL